MEVTCGSLHKGGYTQSALCGSMREWADVSVWVGDVGGSLLPFPSGSIRVREYKEVHGSISMGVS